MKLLAIDPGFKRFGYAIFNDKADLLLHDVYSTRERDKDEKYQSYLNSGIESMYHWFIDLLEEHQITNIIAEISAYHRNYHLSFLYWQCVKSWPTKMKLTGKTFLPDL